jgi:hypothetical protein
MNISGNVSRQQNKQRRPTESEALEMALRLINQWTQPAADEYFDALAAVFRGFSIDIVERCVDPVQGIARTKVNGEPRRYRPAIAEILSHCESTVRSDFQPRPPVLPVGPPLPPPKPEEVARVQAKLKEAVAGLTRAMGRRSPEDQRAEAEQVLARSDHAKIDASESLRRSVAEQRAALDRAEEKCAWLADPPLGG